MSIKYFLGWLMLLLGVMVLLGAGGCAWVAFAWIGSSILPLALLVALVPFVIGLVMFKAGRDVITTKRDDL